MKDSHRGGWPAAKRAAAAYRANREDLEPLIRLLADVVALAAAARRLRPAAAVPVKRADR